MRVIREDDYYVFGKKKTGQLRKGRAPGRLISKGEETYASPGKHPAGEISLTIVNFNKGSEEAVEEKSGRHNERRKVVTLDGGGRLPLLCGGKMTPPLSDFQTRDELTNLH